MIEVKTELVDVERLRPADWNVNRVPEKTLKKIKRSIERYGFVENLVARAHPTEEDALEVISGNHRLKLLLAAKVKEVPVAIVEVDDQQARLLGQAMNRTRGRDEPEAYRKLMAELMEAFGADEVSKFLPNEAKDLQSIVAPVDLEAQRIYGVIVECTDEADQVALLDQLLEEGIECRALLS